ncbi:MAG: CHASE domain-containing protein [Phycisphaerales bacterium]
MSMWFQGSSSRRYLAPVVVICAGVALSLLAFNALRNEERQVLAAQFEIAADDRISALARELEDALQGLRFVERFFAGSHKVERDEFRVFVEPYTSQHPGLQALEWIPRVPDAERAAYEEAAKKEFPDFQITEQGAQGRMIPAKRRPEYFPVYYVEPYAGNESALGFDLGSDPTRLEALTRARDTGHVSATAAITLVQEIADQSGMLVFLPVYRNGAPTDSIQDRRENLEGFALAVFRITDLMETALDYLEPQGIDVHLYDMSPPVGERLLHFHPSRMRSVPVAPALDKEALQRSTIHKVVTLDVAGREWSVVCTATPEFVAASRGRESWGVLATGLFVTGLLATYLVGSAARAARLTASKTRLENEIAQRRQAVEALRIRTDQLTAVTEAMTAFLESGNWQEASARILRNALSQTGSEYGFVGVVVEGPALRILVHEGIQWDAVVGRELYDQALRSYRELGYLEFTNFQNLFGKVITERRAVISSDPPTDPRSGGLPPGHPPLRHFLGVPIFRGTDVVGMIGVANRPEGYAGTEQDRIEILCRAAGVLYDSYRRRQREDALEQERKRAQEERLRLIQVEHERNRLKEAVAAQEQLLGVVGHELRTPLAALRVISEHLLTEDARQTDEWDFFLRSINDETIRMANMVDNLLEAAQLNSGTVRWNWGTVRLEIVCHTAIDEIRPLVDAAKIHLECCVEPANLAMSGDADAIRRLVLNLVNNSHKHTAEGSIRVMVRRLDEPQGPRIEITVQDTGEGIAPHLADRLGTAFALNAGIAGASYTKGTGLGLAICKGIVAAHGGTLSIQSAQGKGTTITVRLRTDLGEAAADTADLTIEREIAA